MNNDITFGENEMVIDLRPWFKKIPFYLMYIAGIFLGVATAWLFLFLLFIQQ